MWYNQVEFINISFWEVIAEQGLKKWCSLRGFLLCRTLKSLMGQILPSFIYIHWTILKENIIAEDLQEQQDPNEQTDLNSLFFLIAIGRLSNWCKLE